MIYFKVTMDKLKVKKNIKLFDSEEYSVWEFWIRTLLKETKLIDVIDKPAPELLQRNGQTQIQKLSVVIDYLSDALIGYAKSDKSAQDILKNLDEI